MTKSVQAVKLTNYRLAYSKLQGEDPFTNDVKIGLDRVTLSIVRRLVWQ